MKAHTCPKCEGRKTIAGDVTCPTCGGEGVVWEPIDEAEVASATDALDLTDYPAA